MLWSWARKTINNRLAAAWTAAAVLTLIGIIPTAVAVGVIMAERAAAATQSARTPLLPCHLVSTKVEHPDDLSSIKIEETPQPLKENAGTTPCAVFF